MKRSRTSRNLLYPALGPWTDAFRAWEIGIAAPQVIGLRMLQMLGSNPDPDEVFRMSNEKLHAFGEAWLAMMRAPWLYSMRLSTAWVQSGPQALVTTAWPNLLGLAMKPVHRTVVANHRRLSRIRRTR